MALTAAERAKRYRERLKQQQPDKYEDQRKKQCERLKKSRKRIADLPEEEQIIQRKKWRNEKKNQKIAKETKDNQLGTNLQSNNLDPLALPLSPSFKIKHKKFLDLYRGSLETIKKLKTKVNTLKKKLNRANISHNKEVELLQTENNKMKARQETLELSLPRALHSSKTQQEKQIIKNIGSNDMSKGLPTISNFASGLGLKSSMRRNKKLRPNKIILRDLEDFYIRDDISRSTARKKETLSKNKNKVQIRYLVDTLINLYEVYKKEGGKRGFTTFWRYKPFYILTPAVKKLETCIKHRNIDFLFTALKKNKILDHKDLTELLGEITCDEKSDICMYNKCDNCKKIKFKFNEEINEEEVTWFQWERVKKAYRKLNKDCETNKTVKLQKKGSLKNLIEEFKSQLVLFKTHYFNWKHQVSQYQRCIKNLKDDEIAILCDFSENYECKLGEEVQARHYGASKKSITLHCGMVYWQNQSQSFVSISDNTSHEPNAIWAHLLPILKSVKELDPHIKIIHFFSDGSTSQYRQKKNFFLVNHFTKKLGLRYTTWSFSESGHGKGVAGGIGGTVKRQLDRHVAYGNDVTDAQDAYQHLSQSMNVVKCFLVSDNDIVNVTNVIPHTLKAVPEAIKLHQILSVTNNEILYRSVSCFCGEISGLCYCFCPKKHIFIKSNQVSFRQQIPCVAESSDKCGSNVCNEPARSIHKTQNAPVECFLPEHEHSYHKQQIASVPTLDVLNCNASSSDRGSGPCAKQLATDIYSESNLEFSTPIRIECVFADTCDDIDLDHCKRVNAAVADLSEGICNELIGNEADGCWCRFH